MTTAEEEPRRRLEPVRNVNLLSAAPYRQELWEQSDVLRSIYWEARRRSRSPWAFLGVVLIREIANIPPTVRYVSAQGSASLNTFAVIVGATGAGKGLIQRVVDEVGMRRDYMTMTPGSGEGIPDAFAHHEQIDGERTLIFDHDRALAEWDEVGQLFKTGHGERSTVYDYLKTAWSGAALGRELAGKNGVRLPADSYRLCALINAQPRLCGDFFTADETHAGFPGRLLWFYSYDPDARAEHADAAQHPPLHRVYSPDWTPVNHIIGLPEMNELHLELAFRAHEENDDGDPLAAHSAMVRTRVATGIAAMHGRTSLTPWDWELSATVMVHSDACRNHVRSMVDRHQEVKAAEKARLAGIAHAIAGDTEHDRRLTRVLGLLRGYAIAGRPENTWRKSLNSRDRRFYDEAIEHLRRTP